MYLFIRKHGGLAGLSLRHEALSGNEGCSESTHNPGNIGTNGLAVRDFLKASQNGVVVESSPLDHNVCSQFCGVRYFDDFVQGVLND